VRDDSSVTDRAPDRATRATAIAALCSCLLPPIGAAAALIFSAASWTNADDRALSDPSGLWAIVAGPFVALGVGLSAMADGVREVPRRQWQRVPGLDRGFIEHFSRLAGTKTAGWILAGKAVWGLSGIAIATFVIGSAAGSW